MSKYHLEIVWRNPSIAIQDPPTCVFYPGYVEAEVLVPCEVSEYEKCLCALINEPPTRYERQWRRYEIVRGGRAA